LHLLPCPYVLQLHLQGLKLQLGPAGHLLGVLHHCTRLTVLHLQSCTVQDSHAACAAIAALPELQQLAMSETHDEQHMLLLDGLQLAPQLTHLHLDCGPSQTQPIEELGLLSALTNLQHLELANLPHAGVPGGVPSQLVKLTCLHMGYNRSAHYSVAQHFGNLGSLTALQQLHIATYQGDGLSQGLSGIQYLSALTSLDVTAPGMKLFTTHTSRWARLTALQSLALRRCILDPQALAAFTQLHYLYLEDAYSMNAYMGEFLDVLSELRLLTELRVHFVDHCYIDANCPADLYTAFTASTNLRSLDLDLRKSPAMWELFPADTEYLHLRQIKLISRGRSNRPTESLVMSVGKQQLQQMCSCCPTLDSLAFLMRLDADPAALCPLLQLTAL
jgi:hypothetical protein